MAARAAEELTSKSYDSTVGGALQDPPGAAGSIPFHDANYSTSFTYRGNPTYVTSLGTSTRSAYQTTGVTYQAQNWVGTLDIRHVTVFNCGLRIYG
jgi:hypothetical protein